MINDNRSESNFDEDKEAPISEKRDSAQQPKPGSPQESHRSDAKDRFSSTMDEQSEQSAQEKGGWAARKLLEGSILGTGKKIAEKIWEQVEEYLGGGDM